MSFTIVEDVDNVIRMSKIIIRSDGVEYKQSKTKIITPELAISVTHSLFLVTVKIIFKAQCCTTRIVSIRNKLNNKSK